ncbi:MAG: DUF4962 domain-containing protein [Planctomycetota bacterium]
MNLTTLSIAPLCAWLAAAPTLDEKPAQPGEWGYRPAAGTVVEVTPPGFSWRPSKGIVHWELQVARGPSFSAPLYEAKDIEYTVHCPPLVLPPGQYAWRYRGINSAGEATDWSEVREFSVSVEARPLPMPPRTELLGRIPQKHPRLFIRPEDLPELRKQAQGPLKKQYDELVRTCEKLLRNPPPTKEPPKYPEGIEGKGEEWREIWWGNRVYTINALDSAATLAFTRLIGGKEEYGQAARKILMECAQWDPKGSTGYRYNDEAGMPYNSRFARTYTFVYDLLTPAEREECRRIMKIRGEEMYKHLCPRHLWQPYASHSNRAWHFLGEVGVAFHEEIEGAQDWTYFAMNVFYNVYPVWCDDDGGWHEGNSYWNSYIARFTWWADIMRSAMGVDAYQKPYFSRIGYYPMYLMPPGTEGGGFGDLCGPRRAESNVPLVSQLAAQAGNGHWQWYVEQMGGPKSEGGYVGFVRGTLPTVEPVAPEDLPTSRLFRGTGQAYLNTSLLSAKENVQVNFKSSPFGTQSHGYDANNSFLLKAYGERLLVSSGTRDMYGSAHHSKWMWSTRSGNNITVDGFGQLPHSAASKGKIVAFATTPSIDAVAGEAGEHYLDDQKQPLLDRFTRTILFVKPELIVVFDRLVARNDASYQYWLHATNEIGVRDQNNVLVKAGNVECDIAFLHPRGLRFTQTNEYDPNPRPRVKLREWHLTASTPAPSRQMEFVTLYRPHREGETAIRDAQLQESREGYLLRTPLGDGSLLAWLPTDDGAPCPIEGVSAHGVVCRRLKSDGSVLSTLVLEEHAAK